ncbi:hypothetical protein [Microbispora sp. NPDC049633]|uniref:hypothetical protein n=1 Tax=Microbispora sp. NPDC049633 TaxID=3154355 RepID=UPI00341792DF
MHFASGPLAYDRDDAGQHKRIVAGRFAAYEREMRGFVAEHQHLGREGADQFLLGTPPQEGLDRTTAARPRLMRLKDYVPGFATGRPSPGRAAR